MKRKKTYTVEDLKNKVNHMILHSPDRHKNGRESLGVLLESVLMETGNYRGFGYLTPDNMKASENGISFGIQYDEKGNPNFEDTDHTRVNYY